MTSPEKLATPDPVIELIEKIAVEWDGCEYDAPGESLDIGDAIRRKGFPLAHALRLATQRQGEGEPTQAARDVLAERQRQISAEGWTPEHDDEHKDGAMAIAAACYALWAQRGGQVATVNIGDLWRWTGWGESWFKPKDPRRDLVRAGALIVAEIERLDRAASPQHQVKKGEIS